MVLDIIDNPFEDVAEIELEDIDVREAAPSMPDTKVQDLLRAVRNERFDKQKGLNERFLLNKEYFSIASNISAELGPFTLDTFEDAQMLVEAGVLRIINEGDRTGSFRGQNAAGGSQWDMEGLNTNTFDGEPGDRVYETEGAGTTDLIPGAIGEGENGTMYLDEDTQVVFIMGWYSSTNPRAVEHVQIGVDDGERRTAQEVYSHNQLSTLQAFESPSIEYITDDDAFDINISATEDTTTDFFPYGVDINTAAGLADLEVAE